ncbi:MAG: crossover junction endodeoxyribonuclease RuvC [Patescibacteria group bacterium]
MVILGLDPGYAALGYGVIKKEGSKISAMAFGVIKTGAKTSFPKRLVEIAEGVGEIIKKYKPELVAIEKLFFFKNQKTAIDVSQARGAIVLKVAEHHLPVKEFTPLEVKQALTGYGRADKRQMQEMVKILFGLKTIPKPDDAADALAIAYAGGVWRR